MNKLLFAGLFFASVSITEARCVVDATEVGDIGPDSERVCHMLLQRMPAAEIEILTREIKSRNAVSLTIEVDGQLRTLDYRLAGMDWVLSETDFASR